MFAVVSGLDWTDFAELNTELGQRRVASRKRSASSRSMTFRRALCPCGSNDGENSE